MSAKLSSYETQSQINEPLDSIEAVYGGLDNVIAVGRKTVDVFTQLRRVMKNHRETTKKSFGLLLTASLNSLFLLVVVILLLLWVGHSVKNPGVLDCRLHK